MPNYNRKDSSYFASTANLIKSSLIALLVSIILLITVILPAEYAIDPTGVGRVLNLTQMGEIKMSLAQEAEKEEKMTESMEDPIKESTQSETTDKSEAIKTDEKTFVLQPGEKMEKSKY